MEFGKRRRLRKEQQEQLALQREEQEKQEAQRKEQEAEETQKKWQQLKEAVLANNTDKINDIAQSLSGLQRKPEYYDLCAMAIENEASETLKTLLKNGKGFDFTVDSVEKDRKLAKKLVEKASRSSMQRTLLVVLSEANGFTSENSRIDSKNFKPALSSSEMEGYKRIDAYTLGEEQSLPDGSTLTTLFNFRSRQQQLIYKAPDTAPTISQPVNFDDLDQDFITALAAKLGELNRKASPAPIRLNRP